MTLFALSRSIGPIPVDVVVREQHESNLVITMNPVEFGSAVSDHAYAEPKKLILDAVMGSRTGPNSIPAAYQSLVRLQETREPFDVVTGLMIYRNMLVERLTVQRDSRMAAILYFTAELREVIIVDTETVEGAGDGGEQGRRTKQSGKLNKARSRDADTAKRADAPKETGNQSAKTVDDGPESDLALTVWRRITGGGE
jgi:hypothetical protein